MNWSGWQEAWIDFHSSIFASSNACWQLNQQYCSNSRYLDTRRSSFYRSLLSLGHPYQPASPLCSQLLLHQGWKIKDYSHAILKKFSWFIVDMIDDKIFRKLHIDIHNTSFYSNPQQHIVHTRKLISNTNLRILLFENLFDG